MPYMADESQRDFYKYRSRPVFKAVLIAIFTYEIIYWGWLKLESLETKHDTEGTQEHDRAEDKKHGQLLTTSEGEIRSLENELRHLTKDKSEAST
jgi:hypothetical protein